ncbi:phosphoribosylaminoimidazolesuccinocarboxamide synthase [Desulfomarina sp.]
MITVTTTSFPELELVHRGKVRDMYSIPGHEDKLLMVATDRISAYDVVMEDAIPGKGAVLTELSLFWFKLLGGIIDNHLISAAVDEYPEICHQYREQLQGRSMLVRRTRPLSIECIVRGYISGSFWKAYQENTTVCGFELPVGMKESEKFPQPLFTPSTKAEIGDHDENISLDRMAEIVGEERARQIADVSIALYKRASEFAGTKGIIIADTKFELGEIDGKLILIDEVLTPDSSRFWPEEQYEPGKPQPSFDKQFLRDYLSSLNWNKKAPAPSLPLEIIEKTRARYEEAVRKIVS